MGQCISLDVGAAVSERLLTQREDSSPGQSCAHRAVERSRTSELKVTMGKKMVGRMRRSGELGSCCSCALWRPQRCLGMMARVVAHGPGVWLQGQDRLSFLRTKHCSPTHLLQRMWRWQLGGGSARALWRAGPGWHRVLLQRNSPSRTPGPTKNLVPQWSFSFRCVRKLFETMTEGQWVRGCWPGGAPGGCRVRP